MSGSGSSATRIAVSQQGRRRLQARKMCNDGAAFRSPALGHQHRGITGASHARDNRRPRWAPGSHNPAGEACCARPMIDAADLGSLCLLSAVRREALRSRIACLRVSAGTSAAVPAAWRSSPPCNAPRRASADLVAERCDAAIRPELGEKRKCAACALNKGRQTGHQAWKLSRFFALLCFLISGLSYRSRQMMTRVSWRKQTWRLRHTDPPTPRRVVVQQTSGQASANGAKVSVAGFAFGPQTITIKMGDSVTWSNDDGPAHTITFKDGSAGTKSLPPAQMFTRMFDKPGLTTISARFIPI